VKDGNIDRETQDLAHRLKLDRWLLSQPSSPGRSPPLSSGEGRRAALLMAMLQDRPIFVFDEWTNDQDPRCKFLFYNEIPSYAAEANRCDEYRRAENSLPLKGNLICAMLLRVSQKKLSGPRLKPLFRPGFLRCRAST
jgi:hypothetical protein